MAVILKKHYSDRIVIDGGKIMAVHNHTEKKKAGRTAVTFTVAECGEFHTLGEYHEDIGTLEEAAAIYRKIKPERMNGIPSIGIKIHAEGTGETEDMQFDILSGREIDRGILMLVPDGCGQKEVQEIIRKLAEMFPDKEIADI